jgi:hypothetical protein
VLALARWENNRGQAELGHVIMRLYQRKAEAFEILDDYSSAAECYEKCIDICLEVLQAGDNTGAANVFAGEPLESPAPLRQLLDHLREHFAPVAETLPLLADGVGQFDAVHFAISTGYVLFQHFDSLDVLGAVETEDEVGAVQNLADYYWQLARMEWTQGNLSQAYQSLVRGLVIQALLPSIESRLPTPEAPSHEQAPRKADVPDSTLTG